MNFVVEEGEILVLVTGTVVLFFIYKYKFKLISVKNFYWLITSYLFFFLGWIFTVAEGLILNHLFNFFEHFSYFLGSLLLVIWVIMAFIKKEA